MIGVEESHVFYNHRDGITENRPYPFSPADELPTLSECALFFRQFLHSYDSARLVRKLLSNVRIGAAVLDINCEAILNCKPLPVEECIQTPFCGRTDHIPPLMYLQQLYKALSLRPLHYLPICEAVCYEEIQRTFNTLQTNNTTFQEEPTAIPQIQITLLNTSTHATLIRALLADMQEKFVVVPGIIVQAGKPIHKVSKMTLQCRYCDHKMAITVPVWKEKPAIPRVCQFSSVVTTSSGGITETIDRQRGCKGQLDPYVIVPSECTYIDVQSLRLQELPEDVSIGDMPRQLHLNASRNLCEKMFPGDRAFVHGVLTSYDSNPKGKRPDGTSLSYLHVLGYQKHDEGKGEEVEFSMHEKTYFQKLASSQTIFDKIFNSIAPDILGMENVKKAAASLLFGGTHLRGGDGCRIRGDINVLLLGDPSVAKSQILKYVNRLSPISVYTSGKGSSAAGLTAAVIRDKRGIYALEGGAMVLADGGVVCVDEFDKMGEEDVVAIHEAMEQQTISISKAGITTMLNTRCAVLAAANPSFGSFDDSQDTAEQHDFKATILSRFDLIFMLRDKEDIKKDTLLCQHILNVHAQKNVLSEGEIPLSTLRKYIQYARQNFQPTLSKEAADSLNHYYVQTREASRQDRRASTRKIPITIRQLESLSRIAASFAKMELKEVATETHVQMAIELFTVSTAETAKHSLIGELLSPAQSQAVKQAETAILGRLPKGQRATRSILLRDLKMKGFDGKILLKALLALIKRGVLQERGDLSVYRS